MLVVGNGNDDKLPSSLLEKLFKDALIGIKENCHKYFNSPHGIQLEGIPYLGTSKIIFVDIDQSKKPILVLKPGLWRGENSQWNIRCEVFEKDIVEIAGEELRTKVISKIKTPIGLDIIKRH